MALAEAGIRRRNYDLAICWVTMALGGVTGNGGELEVRKNAIETSAFNSTAETVNTESV
jgi:hypothetical protein